MRHKLDCVSTLVSSRVGTKWQGYLETPFCLLMSLDLNLRFVYDKKLTKNNKSILAPG